eukprot:3446815-Pleurochrysis_carterae.AAC.4
MSKAERASNRNALDGVVIFAAFYLCRVGPITWKTCKLPWRRICAVDPTATALIPIRSCTLTPLLALLRYGGGQYVLEGHYDASKKAALHVRKADSGRPLVRIRHSCSWRASCSLGGRMGARSGKRCAVHKLIAAGHTTSQPPYHRVRDSPKRLSCAERARPEHAVLIGLANVDWLNSGGVRPKRGIARAAGSQAKVRASSFCIYRGESLLTNRGSLSLEHATSIHIESTSSFQLAAGSASTGRFWKMSSFSRKLVSSKQFAPLLPPMSHASTTLCRRGGSVLRLRSFSLRKWRPRSIRRHDEEIVVEFESPVMPDTLRKLRASQEGAPKKEKKGKKSVKGKAKSKK